MRTVKKTDLASLIGTEVGVSEWLLVDQERINAFADVTFDHQFIHINPERAAKTPFGGTIAHGFLTLSLMSKFSEDAALRIDGVVMGINYGFEKVRFINPVRSGSRVRGRFTLKDATEKKEGQFLLTYAILVEIEGEENPALIADWLGMQILN